MAMTANADRQPGANEEPAIGCLLRAEGKAVTHFIQSLNDVASSRGPGANQVQALSAASSRHTSVPRPKRTACCLVSADPPDDYRTEAGRYRQRQPLPERDKRPEFGVERVQIWQRVACRQAVLIDERRRLEAPVALERK